MCQIWDPADWTALRVSSDLLCIFVLTLIVGEEERQRLPSNIQPGINNVQTRTFSKETWWGHNIDNSIDNFDILFNVAEPSHFIEERVG